MASDMLYFFVWERDPFVNTIVPVMAASWKARSFTPCQEMCRELVPVADAFASRYCLGGDPLVLNQVVAGIPFERHCWRCLMSEILMIGAAEIPEIETAPDSICCILAPEKYREENGSRQGFAPIQHVHFGSQDLVFGGAFYRPEQSGWNDQADVERLAGYLAAIDPGSWTVADLQQHRELANDQERAEELAYVREWFPAVRDLYHRAHNRSQILICEVIS